MGNRGTASGSKPAFRFPIPDSRFPLLYSRSVNISFAIVCSCMFDVPS